MCIYVLKQKLAFQWCYTLAFCFFKIQQWPYIWFVTESLLCSSFNFLFGYFEFLSLDYSKHFKYEFNFSLFFYNWIDKDMECKHDYIILFGRFKILDMFSLVICFRLVLIVTIFVWFDFEFECVSIYFPV